MMPFFKSEPVTAAREFLDRALSQMTFDPKNMTSTADHVLTSHVHDAAYRKYGQKVLPLSRSISAYEALSKGAGEGTPRVLARRLGKSLGANLIFTGAVWVFTEKMPGAAGMDRPSSVAFSVYLLEAEEGTVVWKAACRKVQRTSSEAMVDLRGLAKGKFKWLTAGELAREEIQKIFKPIPLR